MLNLIIVLYVNLRANYITCNLTLWELLIKTSCYYKRLKMGMISQYIKSITLVYNSNTFTSIIGDSGDVLHLSEIMRKLVCNAKSKPTNIRQFNLIPVEIIDELEKIHNQILQSQQSLRYIYMGENSSGEFMLFRGTKYPIFKTDNRPLAIFTIEHKLKAININNKSEDYPDYCFELTNYELNSIEQLILFYASFGFSHGETYYFISKFTELKLKMDNFKYYHKQLLKKFHVTRMCDLINSVAELKQRKFIPYKLLRNAIFILKDRSYTQN